jgi:PAS domain S-box-containing protein
MLTRWGWMTVRLPVTLTGTALYSFSDRNVAVSADALESALRSRVPWPVNFYLEYLESRRFDDKGYQETVRETLQETYGGVKLDLVIVNAYPALEFALGHRDDLFPGVPIVFFEIDARRIARQKMWPGVTGVTDTVDFRGTIDLALSLHPKTTTVAVITENSPFERYWLAAVHAELLRHQDKVTEIDLVGLPTYQLLEKVAALPQQTVILFQEAPKGSTQPAIGAYDILATVGQRFPTYCIFPVLCLNHGGIGGAQYDSIEQTTLTADLAGRVLSGEPPENIPVVHGSANQIRVDWRQLHHWHIPESALPLGSVVLYREPTLWERGRNYIIAAVVVVLAQALLIFGLLWQGARKRKAEVVLRESEKRFRVMADTTPSLIWMCDQEGKVTYLNDRLVAFTGWDTDAGYGDTWTAYIHPDDLETVLAADSRALEQREAFSKEYRLRRRDGVYRWMFDVASPRLNGDGSFAGFIGSAIDVTDQKMAQDALENVSGRLIEAQERERTRIARDLHDDICQRLALVSVELAQVNRDGVSVGAEQRLEEIRQQCSDIAGDVQALSHQLHSSKLEYLGVVAAIKGFCKEFSKQQDVKIAFDDQDVPRHLPKDISLCLFRVTQEALHNAAKYSGVRQFAVELSGTADEVQLVVSDAGAGFDVEAAKRERGLGLVSMQERVHLVHGRFDVESRPGVGTKVVAVVPVPAADDGLAAGTGGNKAADAAGVA